ncbi:MAG: DUF4297 domain-containing protein [Niastella sp.]|nr:DUF4297 domain-containing protein [Niastella sp.]
MKENNIDEKVNSEKNIPQLDAPVLSSPDSTLSPNDPGDEVLHRFRYQISYAAILSLMMADGRSDIIEVFCEHHEDILVKSADGSFTGIQIKTRNINLHPFNLDDEAVFNTFKRFVVLNEKFPDKFKAFSIVSNHGFDTTKPAVCIETLIRLIKEGATLTGRKNKGFINKLVKECDCTQDRVFNTISKIRTRSYCALNDIHSKLVNQVKICSDLKGLTESKIEELADSIIGKHFKASSLEFDSEKIHHAYILGELDENGEIEAIVSSKCFTKDNFSSWLRREKGQPVKLLLKDRMAIAAGIDTHRRLEIKMDAGGIDSDNIELIRTLKFAFEQHAASWLYRDSAEVADGRYSQILLIIQNMCKEIYDELQLNANNEKGTEMLVTVRAKIKARQENDPALFHDCLYEHVLGVVGVLTESCKIWWSPKFNISE